MADWSIYEVAASESGSFFTASINFGFTILLSCHYNTDFVKKMSILEEKNVKVHRHMHSANPQALLTRFVSMGNENQTTVWLGSGKH